ncbi:MAG: aldehyde dehydrogenase family protein [Planctomycetota bacterium]
MTEIVQPTSEEIAELVETRRDLHRYPELAYKEHRTAGLVAARLEALGYAPRTGVGGPGVVALLEGSAQGPCVLLRADMDALPIGEANDVPYRLAGYIFTSSLRTAFEAAETLEVGMVGVNNLVIATAEAPFGGIKQSGFGREGGAEGIDCYTVTKYINMRL